METKFEENRKLDRSSVKKMCGNEFVVGVQTQERNESGGPKRGITRLEVMRLQDVQRKDE